MYFFITFPSEWTGTIFSKKAREHQLYAETMARNAYLGNAMLMSRCLTMSNEEGTQESWLAN
jgi:hypothetical protein